MHRCLCALKPKTVIIIFSNTFSLFSFLTLTLTIVDFGFLYYVYAMLSCVIMLCHMIHAQHLSGRLSQM